MSTADRVNAIVGTQWSATVAPTGTSRQAYATASEAFEKQLATPADARRDRPAGARGRHGEGGRALDPGPRADLDEGVGGPKARARRRGRPSRERRTCEGLLAVPRARSVPDRPAARHRELEGRRRPRRQPVADDLRQLRPVEEDVLQHRRVVAGVHAAHPDVAPVEAQRRVRGHGRQHALVAARSRSPSGGACRPPTAARSPAAPRARCGARTSGSRGCRCRDSRPATATRRRPGRRGPPARRGVAPAGGGEAGGREHASACPSLPRSEAPRALCCRAVRTCPVPPRPYDAVEPLLSRARTRRPSPGAGGGHGPELPTILTPPPRLLDRSAASCEPATTARAPRRPTSAGSAASSCSTASGTPTRLGAPEVTGFLSHLASTRQRQRLHAEPGLQRAPLPLPRGARPRARRARGRRARQAARARCPWSSRATRWPPCSRA